ncbi:class I SAM-dependent methyltransferase [Flocculibacter collagenilyticus]|uniref:class I SAM-dependent methyltransferase n=1 Tax=Flocculibacter collagenilyticus TaxID=2744479 RepID=UPI0018F4DEE5|nr:class I SAM-dependent methyltransferase [Flocculibacter collagenilyticus]
MKPALSYLEKIHNFSVPIDWQEFPHGEEIATQIEERLKPWLPRMFGYHLIKLGGLSCQLDTSECPIKHQVGLSETDLKAGVICEIDDLPLAEHSVDAALLAQCIEYYPDPHHILREVHRVLLPGGYIIITAFNPFSLSGAVKWLPYYKNKLPWSGRYFSAGRVKDWLNLLGFEVLSDERFIYSTLSRHSSLSQHKAWRRFCEKYMGPLGSVYMIVARKRVLPLTPIKPRWKVKPQFNPAVKGATFHHSPRGVKRGNLIK